MNMHMKKTIFLCFLLIPVLLMSACHFSEMPNTDPSSEPKGPPSSEPDPPAIQITAPYDFLASQHELTADLEIHTVEGYALTVKPQDTPYRIHYAYMSDMYSRITVAPDILEAALAGKEFTYISQTNFGGLFDSEQPTSGHYQGQRAECEFGVVWRGPMAISAIEDKTQPPRCWLDMLVIADDAIVGILVYELVEWTGEYGEEYEPYTVELCYSECYLTKDGEVQDITEAFALQRIELYHQYEEQKNK